MCKKNLNYLHEIGDKTWIYHRFYEFETENMYFCIVIHGCVSIFA